MVWYWCAKWPIHHPIWGKVNLKVKMSMRCVWVCISGSVCLCETVFAESMDLQNRLLQQSVFYPIWQCEHVSLKQSIMMKFHWTVAVDFFLLFRKHWHLMFLLISGLFSYSRFGNLDLQKFVKRNWIIGSSRRQALLPNHSWLVAFEMLQIFNR